MNIKISFWFYIPNNKLISSLCRVWPQMLYTHSLYTYNIHIYQSISNIIFLRFYFFIFIFIMRTVNDTMETINAAASAIASAENRQPPSSSLQVNKHLRSFYCWFDIADLNWLRVEICGILFRWNLIWWKIWWRNLISWATYWFVGFELVRGRNEFDLCCFERPFAIVDLFCDLLFWNWC